MRQDTLTTLDELEELFEVDEEGDKPGGPEHTFFMKVTGYMDDGHSEEA